MTNRKSHTQFRLVPKSTTLDDLEGPLRTGRRTDALVGLQADSENKGPNISDRPIGDRYA